MTMIMDDFQMGQDVPRVDALRAELAQRIAQAVPDDGGVHVLPGLQLRRVSAPTPAAHVVSALAFCVIAQGSKEIALGGERYHYDPAHYLITTAALPITTRISDASPERPFLTFLLSLDPALVGSVMVEAGIPAPRSQSSVRAVAVSALDTELLDAVVRLVRLVETPSAAHVLAPLVTREIMYRLLAGEQGERLRQIATLGGTTHRIATAIARLRRDYARPLPIEDLADELGMSVSSFHQHFKAVTALSPLEFQKQLRLQEARRLMLGEGFDAATAGFQVGYNDASHFNREYKRFFGEPPMRDVERLRGAVQESASA
jgi:AraC-like DNA-binding protein